MVFGVKLGELIHCLLLVLLVLVGVLVITATTVE